MVYRRRDNKSGKLRPGWTFMARTQTGWKQMGTRTDNKTLAGKIEGMWETLAKEHRAWDLLGRVMSGELAIGVLYDLWSVTRWDPHEVRRRLNDTNLEPLVIVWQAVYARSGPKADSVAHALAHVRALLPEGELRLASTVTVEWLTERLYAYPGKPNTLRKVHSSWSQFFAYCTDVKGLYVANPMAKVTRPAVQGSPIRFYELDVVERIVAYQPNPERRALFALLYGTAIEVSTALALTRADVWEGTKEIRAAGTKAHSRDGVCRVADWAWETVWGHCRRMLPGAPLWPVWNRWTVSDWHRETVGYDEETRQGLNLARRYPLHCARDHWAVRAARAGTPIAVIQAQLGHGSPMLTLTKYGRFLPSSADREKWEKEAVSYEANRRRQVT
jgi:integrase